MTEGLIVAAGKSQRTGKQYKMALDFGGKTMIEKCIASMSPFCSKIYLVTGFNSDKLKTILQGYKNVEIVFHTKYQDGMFSSVKAGLKQINSSRFFFLPGDYPLVSAEVYDKMLRVESEIVVPVVNGSAGHPILFKYSAAAKILNSDSYSNLREFIIANNPEYVKVDCQGILFDIDTMEDYRKALAMLKE
jgi:molybdenum cofactor cytidylyltransferase